MIEIIQPEGRTTKRDLSSSDTKKESFHVNYLIHISATILGTRGVKIPGFQVHGLTRGTIKALYYNNRFKSSKRYTQVFGGKHMRNLSLPSWAMEQVRENFLRTCHLCRFKLFCIFLQLQGCRR